MPTNRKNGDKKSAGKKNRVLSPIDFATDSLHQFDTFFGNLPHSQQATIRLDLRKQLLNKVAEQRQEAVDRLLDAASNEKGNAWPKAKLRWIGRPIVGSHLELNEKKESIISKLKKIHIGGGSNKDFVAFLRSLATLFGAGV